MESVQLLRVQEGPVKMLLLQQPPGWAEGHQLSARPGSAQPWQAEERKSYSHAPVDPLRSSLRSFHGHALVTRVSEQGRELCHGVGFLQRPMTVGGLASRPSL